MVQLLCETCGDDGRQTLEPAHRGGARRVGGECQACPRCAVCEVRLAESRDTALQLDGWSSYCGLCHLAEAMRSRTPAERALYALDLLANPPIAQREVAGVLLAARSWLAEFTRGLLALGNEAGSASGASVVSVASVTSVDVDPGTLRSLAAVRPDVPVVTEMCVECDRVVARRLDLSGTEGGDTAVWSLCGTHARLEAEAIRRTQRSRARTPDIADEASAPQLQLPLRPGLKKVRRSSRDRSRATG